MFFIGIDIGGTGIKAGIINEDGHILMKDSIKTGADRPYQEVVRDIAELCNSLISRMQLTTEQIESIGVGVPGICDQKTGDADYERNQGEHPAPYLFFHHFSLPLFYSAEKIIRSSFF